MDKRTENEKLPQENSESSINSAWESKQYDYVLSKLLEDSDFPDQFNVGELNDDDEAQKQLKEFAQQRNTLHKWIEDNELQKVKEFVSNNESKYYLSVQNHSAASTALKYKKFEIYAYLLSNGAKLKESELDELDSLSDPEKEKLRQKIMKYFGMSDTSHILHIQSKLRILPKGSFKQYKERFFGYLEELNRIPIVSLILKVIQYVENLDLVFNLDDNMKTICPSTSKSARGVVLHNLKTVYIAAGSEIEENQLLGTIAHELTHLAMQAVFQNECNPYSKSDNDKQGEFYTIMSNLADNIKKIRGAPSEILLNALKNYKGEEVFSELIVRVPHILAEFSSISPNSSISEISEGEEWLSGDVPKKLLKFFNKKVVPEFKKFIELQYLSKPKNLNRSINEKEGEIIKIKKSRLFFTKLDKIKNFFKDQSKKVFALITEYTFLGLLRALQAKYDTEYVDIYDKFLVFNLENVLKNLEEVEVSFISEATEILFLECPNTIGKESIKGIKKLLEIVKNHDNLENQCKKIVFVMKEEADESFIKILEDFELDKDFVTETDDDYSLWELNRESRKKISDSTIVFQGIEYTLSNLIDGNEDLLKCVDAGMIQDLLNKTKIKIGSKYFGTSSLEGAYTDVVREVNLQTLIHEINESHDIFLIFGDKMQFEKNHKIDMSLIHELKNFKYKIQNKKRIFFTNSEVTDQDFKEFCGCNSTKKIYLLEMKEKFAFELLKVYNPDFYIKRKFNRVTLKKDLLTKKEPGNLKPAFIIGIDQDCNLEINPEISNVYLLDFENSDVEFERLSKLQEPVDLLKYENNKLLWIKSSGPLSDLHRWIGKEIIKYETELMKEIKNEKLVILADDPGMGKSTTITKLCECENLLATHWVIRINLKDHIKSIREISTNIDTKQVIKFLFTIDSKLNNDFSKNLLDAALDKNKSFSKVLLLCFDGFDELLEETDRKNIIDLLKFLKNKTRSKIWITTRLHFRNILEDELQVLSITFEPIDDSSKIDFIANYMKNRLKLSLTKMKFYEVFEGDNKVKQGAVLQDYANIFLDKVRIIFKKDLERFIGTPLQLHLLIQNSAESFLNWIENSVKPDFSYLGKDLVEVYKNYFDAKYKVYFKKKKILENDFKCIMKEKFEKYHEKLANSLFFEEPATETFKYKSSLLLLGITKTEYEKIEFVHLTFQEYFLAQYLVKSFKNKHCSSCMQRLCNLFMKKILADVEYVLVRHFIDIHLSNNKTKNDFKTYDEELLAVFKSLGSNMVFRFAIIERNHSLLDFLLNLSFTEHDYRTLLEDQWGGELLLHLATREKNDFALKRIIEEALNYNLIESYLPKKNNLGHTAIYLAIYYKNDFALNLIIDTAKRFKILDKVFKNVDSFKATAIHFAVVHANDFALNKIIDEASKIDNLLPELLNVVAEEKGTAFNVAVMNKNDEALEKIIELASKSSLEQVRQLIMIPDRHKNTPLHSAVKMKNEFAFNQIINLALKFNLKNEILSAPNDYKITLFHIAVGNKNDWALKRLIEITPNEILVPLLLHALTDYGDTALHYADEFDDLSLLQKSFEGRMKYRLPQKLDSTPASYKETAFHIAVRVKNDFAVDQIMELALRNKLLKQLLNSVAVYEGTEFTLALNCGNEHALKQASEKFRKELFRFLRCENTPLSLAIKSKNEYAVTKMIPLASNHNLNQLLLNIVDNNTTFHLAIKYDNFFAMNKISSVLDVNQQYKLLNMADKDRKSVFELAALAEDQHFIDLVAEMLLKFSPDKIFELVSFVNQNNEAILHLVFERKKYYAFSRIIELSSKLSVDQQYDILTSCNEFRQTVFHLAVDSENENVVNQIFKIINKFSLEQQRQFLEMKDDEGDTVLDLANYWTNDFVINQISEIKARLGTD